jgi:hypothetical protein
VPPRGGVERRTSDQRSVTTLASRTGLLDENEIGQTLSGCSSRDLTAAQVRVGGSVSLLRNQSGYGRGDTTTHARTGRCP